MTEALRLMVFILGHPTTLGHGPRHAGGTTASLAATATVTLKNLANSPTLHPFTGQDAGAPCFSGLRTKPRSARGLGESHGCWRY